MVSLVVLSPAKPVSLALFKMPEGAAGAVVSSVKPPALAGPVLPAVSVMVVDVVQAPSAVSAEVGMS